MGWQGVPALQEANRRWRERRAVPEVLHAPSQGLLDDARQCLRTRPDACEHHGGAAPIIGKQINFLLLGDFEIGQNTLIRWYTLHVIALPLILSLFLAVHFWRVRQDGGISQPM